MKKLFALIMLLLITMGSYAQKGHYSGGRGSSHKGGHYKNASTGDHYRKHK